MMRTKLALLLASLLGLAVILTVGCDELTTEVTEITIAGHPTADFTISPDSGCLGENGFSVVFRDHSSGQVVLWIWDFGDSTFDTTTISQISHTYDSGGHFTVNLIVVDSAGFDDNEEKIRAVLVDQARAAFTASENAGCAPLSVKFTTTDMSGITDWHWDFGTGDTSAVPNPTYTFADSGTYSVMLVVSSSACGSVDTAYYTDSIRVVNSAVAAFEIPDVTGCIGDSIGFNNMSTNGSDGYKWFFGDGDSSLSENPKHVYDETGLFTITLIARCGDNADTLILEDTLTIDDQPTAEIGLLVDATFVDSTLEWSDNSTGSNILSTWDITLADSTYFSGPMAMPSFIFTEEGLWGLRLITENSCSADTAYDTVTVSVP